MTDRESTSTAESTSDSEPSRQSEPVVKRRDEIEYEVVDAAEGMGKGVLLGEAEGTPNFAMRRFILEPDGEAPRHTNAVEHVQYVLAGEYTVGIDDDAYVVGHGDSIFVPAGAEHWYRNDGPERAAFICVVPHGDDAIELVDS